jgi:hypothetical protein
VVLGCAHHLISWWLGGILRPSGSPGSLQGTCAQKVTSGASVSPSASEQTEVPHANRLARLKAILRTWWPQGLCPIVTALPFGLQVHLVLREAVQDRFYGLQGRSGDPGPARPGMEALRARFGESPAPGRGCRVRHQCSRCWYASRKVPGGHCHQGLLVAGTGLARSLELVRLGASQGRSSRLAGCGAWRGECPGQPSGSVHPLHRATRHRKADFVGHGVGCRKAGRGAGAPPLGWLAGPAPIQVVVADILPQPGPRPARHLVEPRGQQVALLPLGFGQQVPVGIGTGQKPPLGDANGRVLLKGPGWARPGLKSTVDSISRQGARTGLPRARRSLPRSSPWLVSPPADAPGGGVVAARRGADR